jgi:DNA repair protein RecO (recombination protein O)
MLINTRGIILRTLKYSETSIIADIFTESQGLRHYIISGVRSKNARFSAGLMQVMSLVELVAYEKNSEQLSRIKEIKSACVFSRIPFDVRRTAIGMFIAELAQKIIRETEPNPHLFECLFDTFAYLDSTPDVPLNLHLFFAVELASILGFMPEGEYSPETPYFDMQEGCFEAQTPLTHAHYLSPEHSSILNTLLTGDRHSGSSLSLSRTDRSHMLEHLITYFRLHIDYFHGVQSHLVWQEILG